MGRPTKLTPELQERLCMLIRKGVHPETACECEGLGYRTFYTWQERGERALRDGENADPADAQYTEFFRQTQQALGSANAEIEETIVKASKSDWRAGAFILQKRKPRIYGEKASVEVHDKRERAPGALTETVVDEIKRKILFGDHVPRKPAHGGDGG